MVIRLGAALVGVGATCAMVYIAGRQPTARFSRRLPWAQSGVWLKAETHTHTRFSDGAYTADQLAERAIANGCDVLAITDHSDVDLRSATAEYHEAIQAVRSAHPGLIVLAGLEWNVPPARGDDHAAILLPASWDRADRTGELKQRFDGLDKKTQDHQPEAAAAALAWMRAESPSPDDAPVVFLNHPGRRAKDPDAVFARWSQLAHDGAGLVVGAEGAPGHQGATPPGAYNGSIQLEDRWDPSVVAPGGSWDRLLQQGIDTWAALAASDFHSEKNGDYWPCEFSYTAVYAPERSAEGVLRALRAGSFVGVHGGLVRSAQLRVSARGLDRPAVAGEAIEVRAGATVGIDVVMDAPPRDWAGQPNRVDSVDLIAVSREDARIISTGAADANGRWHSELQVTAGGMAVRARGRRVIDEGPDLLFYTNSIRITTD